MRRTFFAIAMIAASLVIVSHLDAYTGRFRDERKHQDEGGLNVSSYISTQILWDTPSMFAMRWDDARKKMLFDCKKVATESMDLSGFRIGFGSPRAEYDFDVWNIGNPVTSSDSPKPDGQIHYRVHWDDSKQCLVFDKATSEKQTFCTSCWLGVGQR